MNAILLAVVAVIVLTGIIGTILMMLKPVTIIDWAKSALLVGAILFMLLVIGGALVIHYVHP